MKWKRHILPTLVVLFLVLNVLYPQKALEGAQKGLMLFLQSILPALLPFFAATSMFIRTGLAHRMANCLSPLMKPLFRLPGASALSFVLCCFGGNPNGSRVTAELYEQGMLTKTEAERTIALASTAGPAFILSVVAGEMLKSPQFGALLWGCYILSSIVTCQLSSFIAAGHALGESRKKTTMHFKQQSPSQIFVDSVRDCAVSLWGVGSFIIFFGTVVALCQSIGLFSMLARPVAVILKPLGFSPQLAEPLLKGITEITEGCNAVCALALPDVQKLPILCAIISFGGFSALAQNYLFARKCGIRIARLALYYTIQGTLGLFFTAVAVRFLPEAQTACVSLPGSFDSRLFGSAEWLIFAVSVLLVLGMLLSVFSTFSGRINGKHRPVRIDTK